MSRILTIFGEELHFRKVFLSIWRRATFQKSFFCQTAISVKHKWLFLYFVFFGSQILKIEQFFSTFSFVYILPCERYHNFTWFSQKLCLSAKFPNQEIRWNYGIFSSVTITNVIISWIRPMRLITLQSTGMRTSFDFVVSSFLITLRFSHYHHIWISSIILVSHDRLKFHTNELYWPLVFKI